ncbi:hypothetical protein MRX96_040298 [Rhipicephalus microplus]
MALTKRKTMSLDTKLKILQDLRQGLKLSALMKNYELAQTTKSTILKASSSALLKAGSSGHADEQKRLWEHIATGDTNGGGVASVEEFLTADSAASCYEELTDNAIIADVMS